jgi:hypothetical protein
MGCKRRVISVQISITSIGTPDFQSEKATTKFASGNAQNRSNKMKVKKQTQSAQTHGSQGKIEPDYARIVNTEYDWYRRLADRIDADPRPRPAGAQRP